MPPDKVCSAGSNSSKAPNKHAEYYFTFTTFLVSDFYNSDQADLTNRHHWQVENELFKVPSRNFAIESEIFSDMFQLPVPTDGTPPDGLSDDRPIRLDGIKKSDFIQLLRVMFPS